MILTRSIQVMQQSNLMINIWTKAKILIGVKVCKLGWIEMLKIR